MKNSALRLPLIALLLLGQVTYVTAQEVSPPRVYSYGQEEATALRQLSPQERRERRDELLQQREAWRQMSPEERQQLRSDIRDAGRSLYPHHPHGLERRR